MSDDVSSSPGRVVPLPRLLLCFDPFRFDMAARRLYRDGAEVHLVPKATAALELLLAHRGHTVTKEEFFDAVWPGIHVSDESLTQTISTARQALGDSAQAPNYIQTVPGRGYRFIAPVSTAPAHAATDLPESRPRLVTADSPATTAATPGPSRPGSPTLAGILVASPSWGKALPWAIAVVSVAIALGTWLLAPSADGSAERRRITRFTERLAPGRTLFVGNEIHRRWSAVSNTLALSPDGARLAYVARDGEGPWQLWLRALDADDSVAVSIQGTEGARSPFFSPDGEWLGFFADGWLRRIPVGGGLPQPICDATDMGASWGPNDTIVHDLATWAGLGVARLDGTTEVLTTPDHERRENAHLAPAFLPDGSAVLFTLWPGDAGGGRDMDALGVVSRVTGEAKLLLKRASGGRYLPPGYVVFIRAGQLQAQPFDPVALEVAGSPVAFYETERGLFSVSSSGDLAYVPKARTPTGSEVDWVDETGDIMRSLSAEHMASQINLSPDGSRVAAALVQPNGEQDIWILDATGDTASIRVSYDGVAALPSWSPDGEWVVYKSTKNGPWETFRVLADGTGEAELLISGDSSQWVSWHPQEPRLIFGRDGDIWLFDLEDDQGPRPLIEEAGNQHTARFSPDGSRIAYTSDEEGRAEIWVRSWPDLSQKLKVSSNGGRYPRWAPDGSHIYYRENDQLMDVPILDAPGFTPGIPRRLFRLSDDFLLPTGGGDYDVAGVGEFVLVKAPPEEPHTEIEIVLNWVEEVRRRVPLVDPSAGSRPKDR